MTIATDFTPALSFNMAPVVKQHECRLITLVFNVHNAAPTLVAVLDSWLNRLSSTISVEVKVVCDDCHDGSVEVALEYRHTHHFSAVHSFQVLLTDDVFEIAANNLALKFAHAESDLIIFAQDDNLMYDRDWDITLLQARQWVDKPGVTALLAGGIFNADGATYQRVETNRPHKEGHFFKHGIPDDQYPLALYSVDFVTRPFAVSTPLLRELGGLGGPGYEKFCFDDTDLSVKLLRQGYTNLYIPFDVVNTSAHIGSTVMQQCFERNRQTFLRQHQAWLSWRPKSSFRKISPMVERDGALKMAEYWGIS